MGIKSDKTFEEIVERLVAVFGIKPSNASASDRDPDAADGSPSDSQVSNIAIVTCVGDSDRYS